MSKAIEASVRDSLESCPRTNDDYLGELTVYEDDENETFVETGFMLRNVSGTSLIHYPRAICLGVLAATSEDEIIHLCVGMNDSLVRITLDPRFRGLSSEELKGRIPQALRIS